MGGRQTSQGILEDNSALSQGQGLQWSETRDKSSWKAGDSTACGKRGLGFTGQLGDLSFVICTVG